MRSRIVTVVVIVLSGVLLIGIVRDHSAPGWRPSSRFLWFASLLCAAALIARGIRLGRPVVGRHAAIAAALAGVAIGAHVVGAHLLGIGLVALAGAVLVWPVPSRPDPQGYAKVWPLVTSTHGDPLAPFAMASTKSVLLNDDASAGLTYRTRLGFAVVSGDPIGDPAGYPQLVGQFTSMCRRRGWRVMVLGCGERRLALWRTEGTGGRALLAVPIGRDVVVDVTRFDTAGRAFRNVRQAVARSHHSGLTTDVVMESELGAALRSELEDVIRASRRQARTERGFSMTLDRVLEGRYPGVFLVVCRDRLGTVQTFQRYAIAGSGTDVSLDMGWRRPNAPNGVDERMTVDAIEWSRQHGARRMSLAFAPFPEIFAAARRDPPQQIAYEVTHIADPLIRLESLFRYLSKFHALGARRYVLVSWQHLPAALLVLFTLEFLPRRRIQRDRTTIVDPSRASANPLVSDRPRRPTEPGAAG